MCNSYKKEEVIRKIKIWNMNYMAATIVVLIFACGSIKMTFSSSPDGSILGKVRLYNCPSMVEIDINFDLIGVHRLS